MKTGIKALFFHFFVLVFFLITALAYFYPVLQGKVIDQSDIVQYTGMAKEQNDFRKETDTEPYWTNGAFGGMPTYQLGANYPHNYVKQLDRALRFLPRPADYLFLYFLGFYILLCCLKVEYKLAAVGALAFGFSSYLIIILGVGHNAKAHAIAYLPMLLGGIVLTFRKQYIWGFALASVAMALEVAANHYQMTYYFMLLVLVIGVVYLIDAIRNKQFGHYFKSVGILLLAVGLGIAVNTTSILATKEYADWSTRGKSSLTIEPDGSSRANTDGLDREYITQYSYGIAESLNIFVPRLFGGSNGEDLGEDSKTFDYVVNKGVPRSTVLRVFGTLPLYWGDQPGVAGPAYIGAIVFFLFVLGIFLIKGRTKWWLLGGTLLSLILSWGKNFSLLTDFMIDYFPLYDKFRAVSSIQVILELCAPILAVLALASLFSGTMEVAKKIRALKLSFFIVAGLGVALFLFKGIFDFSSPSDEALKMTGLEELPEVLRSDRKAVYNSDLFRSMIFVLLTALALWLYLKERIGKNLLLLTLGLLIAIDLIGVDLRYVNSSDFVRRREMTTPFGQTAMDKEILQDPGVFRVYDPGEGINGARTSYFHKSVGGYHAAKPAGIQDLFDFHIYKNNIEVLNMLNVKYVVQEDEEGQKYAALNSGANGNAWFVEKLIPVADADQEIMILDSVNTKTVAVVNKQRFPEIAANHFEKDSAATIKLTEYQPNKLVYSSINTHKGLAVFSEMHYPRGWHAYIDGVEVPHFGVDYVLRALEIPEGEHTITFRFEPGVVHTGSRISLISTILLVLFILAGTLYKLRPSGDKREEP